MSDLLKNIKYDKNGVPILSEKDIENITAEIINQFDPMLLKELRTIPINAIIQKIKNLNFFMRPFEIEFLGRIDLEKSLIELNEYHFSSDINNLSWRFTIAHELGHFFLHSSHGKIILEDTEQMFRIFEKPHKGSVRDWEEWQANTFASAILLPKRPFEFFVERQLRRVGFKRNPNVFIVDNQTESIKHFNTIVSLIQMKSNVSKSVAIIRLERLGYVKYTDSFKRKSAKHISEIF